MKRMKRRTRIHRQPHAVDERAPRSGLQAIAFFEALKGVVVLAVGFGLMTLVHKDLGAAAEHFVERLHISPDRHLSRIFIDAASRTSDKRLWSLAAGAIAYSAVRFIEAYGLWNCRVWAEWFALLSGMLYLPWEIYGVIDHPNWIHWTVLLINVLIVLYMAWVRYDDVRTSPPMPVTEP